MRRSWLAILALPLALAACEKPKNEPAAYHIRQAQIATCSGTAKQCAGALATAGGAVQIVTSTTVQGLMLRLPAPTITAAARAATVSLPFRTSDNLTWNLEPATIAPWRLKSSRVLPGGGPQGTDLAVFAFEATGPGSTTLMFQLSSAPEGGGASVKTYQATVRAQ